MKAVMIGAGRIGRGFLAELLLADKVKLTFFAATEKTVGELNRRKQYEIHVLGNESKNTLVTDVEAFLISDLDALAMRWAQADLIFISCGGKNLRSVGKTLAEAFRKLYQEGRVHTSNIVICENWIDPEKELESAILENLTEEEQQSFLEYTGIGESAVMCSGTGSPEPEKVTNPMDTWVENAWYLPVDRTRLKGELPELTYIKFISDFGVLLKQKLYTRNTSIATIAYLGWLKGLTYVAEGANDPEIEPILSQLYAEVTELLIAEYGIERENQLEFARKAEAKNKDTAIVDVLTRIARDPIRKLGPEDRLIGPLKMGARLGIKPKAVALGCAAALYYEEPTDEIAMKLADLRREKGIVYLLEQISGLKADSQEAAWIQEAVVELKEKGWIREG